MKYKTYAELAAAYKSGELTEPLIMDNDCCFVYVDDEKVFEGDGPHVDIYDILELAGIPSEPC